MKFVFVLCLVVVSVFLLTMAIAPRGFMQRRNTFAYKNPEAHQPSDIAVGTTRVVAILGLPVVGFIAWIVLSNM